MACTVANTFSLFWSLPEQGSATTSISSVQSIPPRYVAKTAGCYWCKYHHLPFTRSIKGTRLACCHQLPAHCGRSSRETGIYVLVVGSAHSVLGQVKNHSKDNCCYMPELFAVFAQTTYHMMHLLQVLGIMWYSWESNQAAAYICRQSLVSEAHMVLLAVSRYSLVNYRSLCIRTQSWDSENAQRNLKIAQILRLCRTYTHS